MRSNRSNTTGVSLRGRSVLALVILTSALGYFTKCILDNVGEAKQIAQGLSRNLEFKPGLAANTSSKPSEEEGQKSDDAPFHFAACLLVMDENKVLPGWLAYHYQVLPLRRVIVAMDVYSKTSPKFILEEYQRELGLNFTLWTDNDYAYNGRRSWERLVNHTNATGGDRYKGYLWRQLVFYKECASKLKREGHEWVAIWDADEYISFNYFAPKRISNETEAPRRCMKIQVSNFSCPKNGSPLEMMQRFGVKFPERLGLEGATIAHFMDKYWRNDEIVATRADSNLCDVMPRIRVGRVDSDGRINDDDHLLKSVQQSVGDQFNYQDFRTLRSRHKYLPLRGEHPGKSMLNVKEWGGNQFLEVHRATTTCFNAKARMRPEPSFAFFRIHHYLGSLQEFFARSDRRRNESVYHLQNDFPGETTVDLQIDRVAGWLEGFVKQVGRSRAHYLTHGLRNWAFKNDAKKNIN